MKTNKTEEVYPKFVYEKEDDILNIWLSSAKIDYAEQTGDTIMHFTKDGQPIYMEILDASRFLQREGQDLPSEIKQKFFSTP